jgi:hypothetical protein
MNNCHWVVRAALVVGALAFTGCATIVNGRYADVHLNSEPTNAHVVVRDNKGVEVASANTPAVVSLKRNRKYFMPAKYTATFESPGYQRTTVPLQSTINPWVAGNIVLGGVPGLAVDTATGAGWKPKHDQITSHLEPIMTAQAPPASGASSEVPQVAEAPPQPGVEPATATY